MQILVCDGVWVWVCVCVGGWLCVCMCVWTYFENVSLQHAENLKYLCLKMAQNVYFLLRPEQDWLR